MGKRYLTRRGYELLIKRLEQKRAELKDVQAQKGEAASIGGNVWHDNFSFEDLCRREQMINWEAAELSSAIEAAIIVDPPTDNATARIGHLIRIQMDEGAELKLKLAGYGESDPERGIVAYDTPLGRALLGAEEGEERSFIAAGRKRILVIKEIG